jgi:hypothetical protein
MRNLAGRLLKHYPTIAATLALVIALSGIGTALAGVIVGSKQIKNGSILSRDIHKAGVRSTDVKNGTIGSADIGDGDVQPQDVTMPSPAQIKDSDVAAIVPTLDFALVETVGSYAKEDPNSILEVDWTGSVRGENGGEQSGCVFQLRVDGQPAPGGAGEVFGRGLTSVSASALFSGLPAGPHQIEIWARMTINAAMGNSCMVGPAAAGVAQTIVVSEQVI